MATARGGQPNASEVGIRNLRRDLRRWLPKAALKPLFAIAMSTFSSTAAVSGFDEGVASYRTGNYADAFKQWTEAAQQGDVDAQYNLGCLYVRGEGVPENRLWAVDWLQRAADQGDLDAATWLLFASPVTDERRKEYFTRKLKPSDRFRLTFVVQLGDGRMYRRSCSTDEKDGAEIEFSLGLMYEAGEAGFPKDDKQAAEWYRRASARDFVAAQTKLAYLYAAGRGIERSQIEAERLFRKAAEQGYGIAQVNLAATYATGSLGHTQDLVLAYVLVSHAADMGTQLALNQLPNVAALLSPDQLQGRSVFGREMEGKRSLAPRDR